MRPRLVWALKPLLEEEVMRPRNCPARCVGMAAPALLAVALLLSSSALAGSLSVTYFKIEADNDAGNASWNVPSTDPSISYDSGTHTWSWSTGSLLSFSSTFRTSMRALNTSWVPCTLTRSTPAPVISVAST